MLREFDFGAEYADAHLAQVEQDEETMKAILAWFQNPKNILYFCGKVGTGKTYFSAALYHSLRENKMPVRAFSEGAFFSDLKTCMHANWDTGIRIQNICDTHCLILDDMGSSDITDWKQEMLFLFVNERYSSGKPTIITSNFTYKELRSHFHERFASRIYAAKNTIIENHGEDRRRVQYINPVEIKTE